MEGKLRDKTRNQTRRMGLGIIPLKEITELAWLRWYGHVVRMGGERYPKIPCQARTEGNDIQWKTWTD
jgi:hypothetical protein